MRFCRQAKSAGSVTPRTNTVLLWAVKSLLQIAAAVLSLDPGLRRDDSDGIRQSNETRKYRKKHKNSKTVAPAR